LKGGANRISVVDMPRKPRVVSARAVEIANMIDREIAARLGPDSTFEERQAVAAAIEAEMMAEFARREAAARLPKDEV
jgi:hypothetical protein